jgi:hypothetical protein
MRMVRLGLDYAAVKIYEIGIWPVVKRFRFVGTDK